MEETRRERSVRSVRDAVVCPPRSAKVAIGGCAPSLCESRAAQGRSARRVAARDVPSPQPSLRFRTDPRDHTSRTLRAFASAVASHAYNFCSRVLRGQQLCGPILAPLLLPLIR